MTGAANDIRGAAAAGPYVTAWIGEQLFGLPIARVQDVFMPSRLTRVPLAPPEVAGVLNLRGRIMTAIDMRRRLGLPPPTGARPPLAIGIERHGEAYGLLIDAVDEVLELGAETRERNPVNLDRRLAAVARGVHRLERRLLVELDVDRVLDLGDNDGGRQRSDGASANSGFSPPRV